MMIYLNVLIKCYTLMHCCAGFGRALSFQNHIENLVDKTLGFAAMQEYLNKEVTFSSKRIDADSLISQLTSALETRLNEHLDLVKSLRDSIAENYHTYRLVPDSTECCHVNTFSHLPYHYKFRTKVDLSEMCYSKSQLAARNTRYATNHLQQQFILNRQVVPGIKYQYFGSNEGVIFTYPAFRSESCTDYDPRLRPWYVEAATSVHKDIVLLIDVSGTMDIIDTEASNDGHTRLMLAKRVAISLVRSLSVRDRVSVVSFGAYAESYSDPNAPCFRDSLSEANHRNKEVLIQYILSLTAHGESYLSRGLHRAYDMLSGSHASDAEQAILVLTDGGAIKGSDDISDVIIQRQRESNSTIHIVPFQIGSVQASGRDVFAAIEHAQQLLSLPLPPTIHLTSLSSSDLQHAMTLYYSHFTTERQAPVLVTPYYDAFGLGHVTTLSLAVHSSAGALLGVVGVDVTLTDLLSDFTQVIQDEKTYTFVTDMQGYALSHHMLELSQSMSDSTLHVHVSLLEHFMMSEDRQRVINDILSGVSGKAKHVATYCHIAEGTQARHGVKTILYNSTYHWNYVHVQIDGMNDAPLLAVVVKVAENQLQLVPIDVTGSSEPVVYHRYTLMPSGDHMKTCSHFSVQVLTDVASAVKFTSDAFINPFLYVDTEETSDNVSHYMDIINSGSNNDVFKPGVIETVHMSSYLDKLWSSITTTSHLYTYVAFTNGVMRIHPAHTVPKHYSPQNSHWYRSSVTSPGTYIMTPPYLDPTGAGYVLTMARSLTKHGVVIAALGMDITVDYLYSLFLKSYPQCQEKSLRCFLMDSAGFLIIHKNFVEISGFENALTENTHITVKEQEVASYLLEHGHMTKSSCFSSSHPSDLYHYYYIGAKTVEDHSGNSSFIMTHLTGTNLFFVEIEKSNENKLPKCFCQDVDNKNEDSDSTVECSHMSSSCECPCRSILHKEKYNVCSHELNVTSLDSVCPPFTLIALEKPKPSKVQGERCSTYKCEEAKTIDKCVSLPECNWCMRSKDGELLLNNETFCDFLSKCYLGQVNFPSPYTDEQTQRTSPLENPKVMSSIAGTIITFVIVMTITASCYCYFWMSAKFFTLPQRVASVSSTSQKMEPYVNKTFAEEIEAQKSRKAVCIPRRSISNITHSDKVSLNSGSITPNASSSREIIQYRETSSGSKTEQELEDGMKPMEREGFVAEPRLWDGTTKPKPTVRKDSGRGANSNPSVKKDSGRGANSNPSVRKDSGRGANSNPSVRKDSGRGEKSKDRSWTTTKSMDETSTSTKTTGRRVTSIKSESGASNKTRHTKDYV